MKIQNFLIKFLLMFFTFSFILFTFISPAYAAVDIGNLFGYGYLKSLGDGTSKLVGPAFSLATAIVVIYFLFGAFKYLKAEANKEELEGARQMITQAIIGFIILIFVFLVLPFVLARLFGITGFQLFNT